MATEAGDDPTFETIDWEEVSAGQRSMGRRTWAFVSLLAALALVFSYDYFVIGTNDPILGAWNPTRLDWLFGASVLVAVFYLLVPLARNRRLTRLYWNRLRTNRLAIASLGFVLLFVFVGLFAPVLIDLLEAIGVTTGQTRYGIAPYQPPYGTSISTGLAPLCAGEVANGLCRGTYHHPLGTTTGGQDVLAQLLVGTRIALHVALITATLLVPIATLVGTTAAYFGGRVDSLLMRYVDLQQVIPAFFVYLIVQFIYGGSVFLLVLVFGLLNWGGVTRLVRSDALEEVESGYVKAAESAGRGRLRIVRRHLLPNVSSTVLTAVTLQIPTLLIIETTVSYLNLGARTQTTWGLLIAGGFTENTFPSQWWIAAFPVLALILTTVSFSVLGDALRDALDPRGGQ